MVLTLKKEDTKKSVSVIPTVQRIANRFILEIILIIVWFGVILGYLIYQSVDYLLLLSAILILAGYGYVRLRKEGF